MTYVLVNPLASAAQKKPIYFKQMTGIGPMTTPNVDEARKFNTVKDAESDPAFFHAWSVWNVQELEE